MKLIAHGNNKQKIQLHHKLKVSYALRVDTMLISSADIDIFYILLQEELSDLTKKCKVLEEENYNLKVRNGLPP